MEIRCLWTINGYPWMMHGYQWPAMFMIIHGYQRPSSRNFLRSPGLVVYGSICRCLRMSVLAPIALRAARTLHVCKTEYILQVHRKLFLFDQCSPMARIEQVVARKACQQQTLGSLQGLLYRAYAMCDVQCAQASRSRMMRNTLSVKVPMRDGGREGGAW